MRLLCANTLYSCDMKNKNVFPKNVLTLHFYSYDGILCLNLVVLIFFLFCVICAHNLKEENVNLWNNEDTRNNVCRISQFTWKSFLFILRIDFFYLICFLFSLLLMGSIKRRLLINRKSNLNVLSFPKS